MADEARKRKGCVGWAVGCSALGVVVIVGLVLAGFLVNWGGITAIRKGIAPGMPVEDALAQSRGWLACRAYPLTPEGRGDMRACSDPAALRRELGGKGSDWRVTLTYAVSGPMRLHFDVDMTSEGRVKKVSEPRWSGD